MSIALLSPVYNRLNRKIVSDPRCAVLYGQM
jgi:hypothetical protein